MSSGSKNVCQRLSRKRTIGHNVNVEVYFLLTTLFHTCLRSHAVLHYKQFNGDFIPILRTWSTVAFTYSDYEAWVPRAVLPPVHPPGDHAIHRTQINIELAKGDIRPMFSTCSTIEFIPDLICSPAPLNNAILSNRITTPQFRRHPPPLFGRSYSRC